MKKIVLLCHEHDMKVATQLVAALRRLVDLNEYEVVRGEQANAFGDRLGQVSETICSAWAVLLVLGTQGFDAEFVNVFRADVQQQMAERGDEFGRLLIRLPHHAEVPTSMRPWVWIDADDWNSGPGGFKSTPGRIVEKLAIKPVWSDGLEIDAGKRLLDSPHPSPLERQFVEVAEMLADGKPLTLMLSPYASVEGMSAGVCPSRVRDELVAAMQDDELRDMVKLRSPPLLWQDHLATLCLLSGCKREEVSSAIEQAVGMIDGDESGQPSGQFDSVAAFVEQLMACSLSNRCVGVPTVTIISVCPGLRMERALIARQCAFERVTLTLGANFRPQLDHHHYRPEEAHRRRAASGDRRPFMPDGHEPAAADDVAFVRLVKVFGSRDLDRGVPSGDLAQSFDLIGQLPQLLQRFVGAVSSGPYVVLGGGLGTPQLQAAHSVLLRAALESGVRRPRLAIVPASTNSPDLLRKAETQQRLTHMTSIPNSGFDRLSVVTGDPVLFLDALTVAFGGSPRSTTAEMAA